MTTPLACLGAFLADDAPMALIHLGRVSENNAPQRDAFPRIVLEATGRERVKTHDGACSLQKLSVRIQFQAKDKDSPEAMRERTSTILDGYRGVMGDITVQGAFEQNAPDEFDPAVNASEVGVFIVAADYDVHFTLT